MLEQVQWVGRIGAALLASLWVILYFVEVPEAVLWWLAFPIMALAMVYLGTSLARGMRGLKDKSGPRDIPDEWR